MKVCNIGSLNIDYVYTVDHFVQPGETTSSLCMNIFAGGKGLNQSIALARAGAEVYHAGLIGCEGQFLKEMLQSAGVDVSMVQTVDDSSGHAIIQVDRNGQNCILLHGGANQRLDEPFVDEVLSGFENGDVLLLQNEVNMLPYIVEKAHAKGMRIALNPSPFDDRLKNIALEHIQWFILNEVEGQAFTGASDPDEITKCLLSRFPKAGIMLTLGKNGSMYADANGNVRQDIFPVKTVDTTAAGDTFTGYFLAGIMQGHPIPSVLRQAALASSITVSREGASQSIPTLDEVVKAEKNI